MFTPLLAMAQKPSLVDFFNHGGIQSVAVSRASDVIVIDLSEWENEYDQTLNIRDGKSYRFINGELKWKGGDAPLLSISNKSFVDFSTGVTVSSVARVDNKPLISLDGGTIEVTGARIPCPSKNQGGGYYGVYYYLAPIEIPENASEETVINLRDGYIGGINNKSAKASISLIKGEIVGISTKSDVYVDDLQYGRGMVDHVNYNVEDFKLDNGACMLMRSFKLASKGNGFVLSQSKLDVTIRLEDAYDGRVIMKGDSYTITQEDFKRVKVNGVNLEEQGLELVLENNKIVLRKNAMTQDDLQAKINAAVGQGPTVIEIPNEGIMLKKELRIPTDAYVELTGGRLTIDTECITPNYDLVVYVEEGASLTLKNIYWDSNYFSSPKYTFWVNGELVFDEGVEFLNTNVKDPLPNSSFIMNQGTFRLNGPYVDFNGVVVNSLSPNSLNGTVIVAKGGLHNNFKDLTVCNKIVTLYDGSIHGNIKAEVITQNGGLIEVNTIECTNFKLTGGDIGLSYNGTMNVTEDMHLSGGAIHTENTINVQHLILDGYSTNWPLNVKIINSEPAKITLYKKLDNDIVVHDNWSEMTFPHVVATGTAMEVKISGGKKTIVHEAYYLAKEDMDRFAFQDIPSGIKASYNDSDSQYALLGAIVLKKKSLLDLFNDADDKGTEENPTPLTPDGTDDVDVEEPSDGKPDLHVLFGDSEDAPEGTDAKKDLHFLFDGEYGLTINKTSSYEFKNINIDLGNHSIDHVIYVDGTLIINVNVYFINVISTVKHVIYIRKGGRLIFRGGKHDIPGVVIHNDGGTIIYEGGDSYGGTHGMVNNGGTVTISGGTIGGNGNGICNTGGGTVNITGGHIYGGGTISGGTPGGNTSDAGHVIYNGEGGTVNILGGDYDDNSSVWSEGSLWLSGNVNIRDYYIRRNITIHIVNRIIINWYFYFIDLVDFNLNIPLFVGDGYILTEEDLKYIHINLPSGYYLVLDTKLNAIFIANENVTSVHGIKAMNETPQPIYSVDGVLRNKLSKGLNIIGGKKYIVR